MRKSALIAKDIIGLAGRFGLQLDYTLFRFNISAMERKEGFDLPAHLRPYLSGIVRVAQAVFRLGWAEANAGNFSIRTPWGLLTKAAGAQMQEIAKNPLPYICVVRRIKGFRYEAIPESRRPTSEVLAHLIGQRTLMRFRSDERALLHTHPRELVCLSARCLEPGNLLEQLFCRCSGLKSIVSVVEYAPPGSVLLARRTGRALKKSRLVIWPRHGVIASGKSLYQALKLIKRVNKSITEEVMK
ncbi:MAG: class II aldolase/adducin family protein [bacterium]